MSDQKMREEFEAAFAQETVRKALDDGLIEPGESAELLDCTIYVMQEVRDGSTYSEPHFASAWWAWKQSRAALMIELAELRADAERYRTVRDFWPPQFEGIFEASFLDDQSSKYDSERANRMDALVDAAMAKEPKS